MPSKMPQDLKKPWKLCADLSRKREAAVLTELKKKQSKTKNDPGFTVDYGTASDRFL